MNKTINKIEEIKNYLLNPHKAIKDNYSLFEALHEVLKAKKYNDADYTDREIYDLYWAVMSYFYEGGDNVGSQYSRDLHELSIVLGRYSLYDHKYWMRSFGDLDIYNTWLNLKSQPIHIFYGLPADPKTLIEEIVNLYWELNFKFDDAVTYSMYVDRFAVKSTSDYTDQEIETMHDKLVEYGYIKPNIEAFTSLCNKSEIVDANRIEWVKISTKKNGKALSALKELITLLFGFDDAPKTDGRKNIIKFAEHYFGETLPSSKFQPKPTMCYTELVSIIKPSHRANI